MDTYVSNQQNGQSRTGETGGPDWWGLVMRARTVLMLAFVVFVATDLLGLTSLVWSVVGWFAVGASALLLAYQSDIRERRAVASAQVNTAKTQELNGVGTSVLNLLPDAIVLVDGRGRILFQNEAAAQFTGRSAVGKLLGNTFREPSLLQAVERVRQGEEAQSFEIERSQPVERHFRVLVTPADTTPVALTAISPNVISTPDATSVNGTGIAALLVLHDVTDAKRIEQMRVDFVANASHELKTPLASVSGFIETLQGPARDDEEARERFLAIMAEQTNRMKRLISDLLSLSRIELREHQPPKGTVDVRQLVKDVVDAVTPIAQRDGVAVSVALPDNLPKIRGDWDELHQVVLNLVDNAVKYGRTGKKVEITGELVSETEQTMVTLSVRDYGPGISRQHIPRLTERFYRIDAATSRERGGTGLGLAIVKHILNRHGGEMVVESDLGHGTKFTISLPSHK